MSDYTQSGAVPVDDAAVADPPTEDEVRSEQERLHPHQAATRLEGPRPSVAPDAESDHELDRQPSDGQLPSDTDVQAERQAEGEAAERAAQRRTP